MKISCVPNGSIYLVLLMICLSPGLVEAMGSGKTTGTSARLQQSYVWYDGEREHTVWLDPNVVAEFNPGPAEHQQSQAEQFDPYPENEPGPELVGARPMEYDKPLAEVKRARWLPWNWGRR